MNETVLIPLTRGLRAVIDAADLPRVEPHFWHAAGKEPPEMVTETCFRLDRADLGIGDEFFPAFETEFQNAMRPVNDAILAARRRVYAFMEAAIMMACAHYDLPDPRVRPTDDLCLLIQQLPGTIERVGVRYELRYHRIEGLQAGELLAYGLEETIFDGAGFRIETACDFTDHFRRLRALRGLPIPAAGCDHA